jgi:hypothetical protein
MTKVVIHNHLPTRDAANTGSNVSNAGIVHLGKSGPGSAPCCGNKRAHQSVGRSAFELELGQNRCKRCEAVAQRNATKRPVMSRPVSKSKELELPPWGTKPAREMTVTELRAWLAKNPRKIWREVLQHVIATKLMVGEP